MYDAIKQKMLFVNNYDKKKLSPLIKLLIAIALIQILLCLLWFIISSIELNSSGNREILNDNDENLFSESFHDENIIHES